MKSLEDGTMRRQPPDDRRGEGNRPGGPQRRGPTGPAMGGRQFRTFTFWILMVLLVVWAVQSLVAPGRREGEITYSEFIAQMEAGNLQSVTFIQQELRGKLRTKLPPDLATGRAEVEKFRTYLPTADPELPKLILQMNPGVDLRSRPTSTPWTNILFSPLLMLGILGVFWLLFIRQMQSGGSAALKFGKSRAKVLNENTVKVTFADVAGADEAKEELQEIIEFLRDPKKFQVLGGRIPKGALLLGPPGTGKTLLAKAIAGEAGVPFFSMSGSDFVEMFVGVGASVSGDTPVLVRREGRTELVPIGEFVDRHYKGDSEGFMVPVQGVETLGFEEKDSKFRGSPKTFVQGSAWRGIRGVFRHRVSEICEIHYLGGVIRTTADHSVFIRTRDGIKAVATADLKPGDVLVNLPLEHLEPAYAGQSENAGQSGRTGFHAIGTSPAAVANWRSATRDADTASRDSDSPIVREVIRKPYDGYVYDLCGCDNEAFFGGEKPILLHNSRVRDLFDQGKRNAPCIIFIDEIDAVGRHRGAGMGGGHDEREQTLNQLLVEMDGFESNEGVILIAATNRPDVLDPALLRPGRFDRQIVVDLPDVRGREGILKVHMKNKPIADDVDVKNLARGTPGMAGADLANLVNEAALLAARRNQRKIMMTDLEDAKDKVMMGTERKSLVMSDSEKRNTAYHESGHALVGSLLPDADPVHKVTMIPRGRALGLTVSLPDGDRYTHNREYCLAAMAVRMGGRAAEELIFGSFTTGAADDIQRATDLARKMVCEWGMSDKLGPLQFGKKQELIFLGREITEQKDYSERTAEIIDEEVHRLVQGAYDRAKALLEQNIDKLHALAGALLEREILDREEIEDILKGKELSPKGGDPPEDEPAPTERAPVAETPEPSRDPALGPMPRPAPGTP